MVDCFIYLFIWGIFFNLKCFMFYYHRNYHAVTEWKLTEFKAKNSFTNTLTQYMYIYWYVQMIIWYIHWPSWWDNLPDTGVGAQGNNPSDRLDMVNWPVEIVILYVKVCSLIWDFTLYTNYNKEKCVLSICEWTHIPQSFWKGHVKFDFHFFSIE